MSLREQLRRRLTGHVVVVGIGNRLRGDDAAGCLVAGRLQETPLATVLMGEEAPERLAGQIAEARPDVIVLVDAVDLGARPGSCALLEEDQLLAYMPSTHRLPLGILMRLLQWETAADVLLLAIQPGELALGAPVSPQVQAAVTALAAIVERALWSGGSGSVAGPPRPVRTRRETSP